MSNLYLILHKVRGQPAFDIAEKLICIKCQSYESVTGHWWEASVPQDECEHCNGVGYTWQIPTSGHTAYPYWQTPIEISSDGEVFSVLGGSNYFPHPKDYDQLRDHFQPQVAPADKKSTGKRAIAFLQRLGTLPIEEVRRA